MDTKESYTKMITAYPGGWAAMAAALGMTRDALENRVYERKGQQINVHTAMQLQAFSQTTFFAESISQESGGIFVKLPDFLNECDHDELLSKFNQLYVELGRLSEKFSHHTQDGRIDRREKKRLDRNQPTDSQDGAGIDGADFCHLLPARSGAREGVLMINQIIQMRIKLIYKWI